MLSNFFEIFNFRFWLFVVELLYFPVGMSIGALIILLKNKKEGEKDG